MPAPQGNLNSVRNGRKVRRLVVGEFPKRFQFLKREGRAYRRAIEDAVVEAHGEVSVMQAHYIDTAAAATVHAAICRWILREKLDGMTTPDVLACSREILKAKETRDRCIRLLQLDGERERALDALYSDPTPPAPKTNEEPQ